MSNENETHTGVFAVGFLVGGLAGAATTLLLAPQSGEETREQIRQKALELQGRTEDVLNEARTKAETVATDIKRQAEALQAQAHVVLEEGQKQLTKAVEETKKAAAAASAGTAAEPETEIVEKPKEIPAKA